MTEFEFRLEQAKKAVTRGKLSRRDFMQFAMASGMTMAAAGTLFSTAARAQARSEEHTSELQSQ